MGNCFRVRGVVFSRASRGLTQFEATGTLLEVIASIIGYTRKLADEIQVLVVESEDPNVCVENAVLEDLSIMSGDPNTDLKEAAEELRKKYDSIYWGEYEPPRATIEYSGGSLKRIVIEKAG